MNYEGYVAEFELDESVGRLHGRGVNGAPRQILRLERRSLHERLRRGQIDYRPGSGTRHSVARSSSRRARLRPPATNPQPIQVPAPGRTACDSPREARGSPNALEQLLMERELAL